MNRDDPRIIAGMRRQGELRTERFAEAGRLGWKAGFGTDAAREKLGTSQPLVGFLTTATQIDSGAAVDATEWGSPHLEAEVAVRLGSDVAPGASSENATASIDGVAAAIELADLGAADDVEEVLAGNIFHRKVALGEFNRCRPERLDSVQIALNGDSPEDFRDPRELIGNIGGVVAALADQVGLAGERLLAGDIVITGAAVPPIAFVPGERYRVMTNFGSEVSVRAG